MMGEEAFSLEVKGDSMINARIYEGDRVRIRKQNHLDNNGDIMAVRVNGDEATLKRVYLQEKWNSSYIRKSKICTYVLPC